MINSKLQYPPHWPIAKDHLACQFSECRRYRYTLWRSWEVFDFDDTANAHSNDYLMVVGLNPSTADEQKNDPTIRRCIDFAQRWGFGGLCMTNLFAYRATMPRVMKEVQHPVGPSNDYFLKEIAAGAGMVLAAWGNHGSHLDRWKDVVAMIGRDKDIHTLRMTKSGHPEHPLYIPGETLPWVCWPKGTPKEIVSIIQKQFPPDLEAAAAANN